VRAKLLWRLDHISSYKNQFID